MKIHRPSTKFPDGSNIISILSHRIGGYFRNLCRHLLRGIGKIKYLAQNDDSGDLKHPTLGLIEVKGGSNREAFQVYEDQLARHLGRLNEFPPTEDSYLYFLFQYNNAEWKKGRNGKKNAVRTLSSNAHNQPELETTLAKQTRVCFVVDINVLEAIRQDIGTRQVGRHDGWSANGHRNIVPVTGGILRKIASEPRKELRRLGFKRREIDLFLEPLRGSIDPVSISLKFHRKPVNFELIPIVPKTMRKKIESLILGNGNGDNGNHH